jgi:hypothetical protein
MAGWVSRTTDWLLRTSVGLFRGCFCMTLVLRLCGHEVGDDAELSCRHGRVNRLSLLRLLTVYLVATRTNHGYSTTTKQAVLTR